MSILDRAKSHFENRPVHQIEVPEWGEGNTPLTVYFKTPNLADMSRAAKESKGDMIEQAARIVVARATDANNVRLFQNAEVLSLMKHVDPAVVSRIANAIMAEANMGDGASAAKNSEPILSD